MTGWPTWETNEEPLRLRLEIIRLKGGGLNIKEAAIHTGRKWKPCPSKELRTSLSTRFNLSAQKGGPLIGNGRAVDRKRILRHWEGKWCNCKLLNYTSKRGIHPKMENPNQKTFLENLSSALLQTNPPRAQFCSIAERWVGQQKPLRGTRCWSRQLARNCVKRATKEGPEEHNNEVMQISQQLITEPDENWRYHPNRNWISLCDIQRVYIRNMMKNEDCIEI
jgi:hypothetical protein